jgi:hypothetical protein
MIAQLQVIFGWKTMSNRITPLSLADGLALIQPATTYQEISFFGPFRRHKIPHRGCATLVIITLRHIKIDDHFSEFVIFLEIIIRQDV